MWPVSERLRLSLIKTLIFFKKVQVPGKTSPSVKPSTKGKIGERVNHSFKSGRRNGLEIRLGGCGAAEPLEGWRVPPTVGRGWSGAARSRGTTKGLVTATSSVANSGTKSRRPTSPCFWLAKFRPNSSRWVVLFPVALVLCLPGSLVCIASSYLAVFFVCVSSSTVLVWAEAPLSSLFSSLSPPVMCGRRSPLRSCSSRNSYLSAPGSGSSPRAAWPEGSSGST